MFSKPLHCFISEREVAIPNPNLQFSQTVRLKLKYPVENRCLRHFQGVY